MTNDEWEPSTARNPFVMRICRSMWVYHRKPFRQRRTFPALRTRMINIPHLKSAFAAQAFLQAGSADALASIEPDAWPDAKDHRDEPVRHLNDRAVPADAGHHHT